MFEGLCDCYAWSLWVLTTVLANEDALQFTKKTQNVIMIIKNWWIFVKGKMFQSLKSQIFFLCDMFFYSWTICGW